MALRIAEPTPLRTAGFGASASGILTTLLSGFQGTAALIGVAILCLGIAILDAVDTGRVGRRQLGLFLLGLGGVVGSWAAVVAALLAMLGLPADPVVLGLLAGAILAVSLGVVLLRFFPAPTAEPAIAVDRSSVRRRRRPSLGTERLDRLAG
jgi:uncharacterized membrane protein (DUF441 family)